MIRHPPASIAVTQKDVDVLASMHHRLLGRIQENSMKQKQQKDLAGTSARNAHSTATDDGFVLQRERRQQMTVGQRLGLEG
ncbi:hypothetical protein COEREDRAFT_80768 [Coemansia reversa NRRL 1564]|uniref:Uncharacterized protein n=1 Tax=Coemansia reversa (strain ATCC 12441 / NRRL 1564) TaxID=763665 RepID=A0A2G5BDG4_COERN|nr:hypothetical protein COEREDRAFT_80768 [Coemansia reversa NRRL 1564]|eukprot:PIA17056.1 hypothetical protein COEREDRAFT_80768 [Coemansia reversa NRRL 1564]